MHAKFKDTSEVQESGKQESHLGPWSSTSFSCKSNSLRSLDNRKEENKVSTLTTKYQYNKKNFMYSVKINQLLLIVVMMIIRSIKFLHLVQENTCVQHSHITPG